MLIETVIEKEKKMGNKYNVNNDEIDIIVNKTKGYSGSDLINVCKEAAMMPIRNIDDICNFQPGELREVNYHDFEESLNNDKKVLVKKLLNNMFFGIRSLEVFNLKIRMNKIKIFFLFK